MEAPLIWTCDDIVRFTYELDDGGRSWAWGWLERHHLAEASRQAARAIRDPSPSVVCGGIHIFGSAPTAEAREAIEELRRRPDLAPSVIQALDEVDHPGRPRPYEDPINDAIERLWRKHDDVRRDAPAMLRSRELDPVLVALGALGNQPYQWATDILVDALPVLLTSGDPCMVWDTFEQLNDPRSLPAIAAVWVPGERYIARVYARIHGVAGPGAPIPDGIARDAEEERKRSEAVRLRMQQRRAETAGDVRRLEMRCTACGRTGDYDVPLEALADVLGYDGAEKMGKKLPTRAIVTCKHCGVSNAYEVGVFSRISAMGGIEALGAGRKRGERGN
jgi:hypothetical protein